MIQRLPTTHSGINTAAEAIAIGTVENDIFDTKNNHKYKNASVNRPILIDRPTDQRVNTNRPEETLIFHQKPIS